MKILITGANGFVGKALLARLKKAGHQVIGAVREPSPDAVDFVRIGDIGPHTDWHAALNGCEVVVHCAARVHMMRDDATDKLAAFRQVNTVGTLALAQQAAAAGVNRFIFLSSIKVNGEATAIDKSFQAGDMPAPQDPYAVSKLEAEQGLFNLAQDTGMEVVCIRPPLVYGPGVKANFRAMIRILQQGVPLPLASIRNKRSLVAIDNLIDLVATCLLHPAAAGQVFLVSDGLDLSTPELLREIGVALHKPTRLFAFPAQLLILVGALLGQGASVRRLSESLRVDIQHTRNILQWSPPVTVEEALRLAVRSD